MFQNQLETPTDASSGGATCGHLPPPPPIFLAHLVPACYYDPIDSLYLYEKITK